MKNQYVRLGIGLVFVAATIAACAGGRPAIAPITAVDAAKPLHGKFVWRDLLTEDVDAVKNFYGELLGWTYTPTALPHYSLIEQDGQLIGGIVDMTEVDPDENQSQWISVLSVPDVDQAARATSNAGGEIHFKPTDLPGRGRFAIVSDPQGAVVAYLLAEGGDPPDEKPKVGRFMWTELWTNDLPASAHFYGELVGYELDDEVILEDVEYVVFDRRAKPRAGVITGPIEKVRPHWLPYVRVEDAAALAEKVEGLGGHLLLAPRDEIRHGTVAIVIDPSGAALALQEWEDS